MFFASFLKRKTGYEYSLFRMNIPDFKVVEFDHFKMNAGLPSFVLSPGHWIEKTKAMGIIVQAGRYIKVKYRVND